MANCIGVSGESGDLFDDVPMPRRDKVARRSFKPKLKTARMLCRQLRRKRAREDKQRIAHLICLSLMSLLKRDA